MVRKCPEARRALLIWMEFATTDGRGAAKPLAWNVSAISMPTAESAPRKNPALRDQVGEIDLATPGPGALRPGNHDRWLVEQDLRIQIVF